MRATRDCFKAHALFARLKCLISHCAFNGFPKNSPANQRFRPALRHTTAHAPRSTKSSDLLTSPGVLLYSIAVLKFFFFLMRSSMTEMKPLLHVIDFHSISNLRATTSRWRGGVANSFNSAASQIKFTFVKLGNKQISISFFDIFGRGSSFSIRNEFLKSLLSSFMFTASHFSLHVFFKETNANNNTIRL